MQFLPLLRAAAKDIAASAPSNHDYQHPRKSPKT
jgi:hypothetical protein